MDSLCIDILYIIFLPYIGASREGIVIVAAIASIIFSGIRLFIEVFQMFKLGLWSYLRSWVNWIELILFTFSIIFVIVFFNDCYCTMLVVHVHVPALTQNPTSHVFHNMNNIILCVLVILYLLIKPLIFNVVSLLHRAIKLLRAC